MKKYLNTRRSRILAIFSAALLTFLTFQVVNCSAQDFGTYYGGMPGVSEQVSGGDSAKAQPPDSNQEKQNEKSKTQEKSAMPDIPWTFLLFLAMGLPGMILAIVMLRQMRGGGMGQQRGFNAQKKAVVRIYEPTETLGVKMDDVVGQDGAKEEIMELIDFLKNNEKYRGIEARMPRGVLFVGPGGVGKTMMVKALAGAAGVPVFSTSGSSFVETFVGTGAARVRDMFEEARKRTPCIIFIDEFDALARARGSVGGNDEREATVNELLTQMDGFTSRDGIIVIAATNRVDILDPAAIRPGRFDRQVEFENPNRADRVKLLDKYLPSRHRAEDINLEDIARGTPNASGAVLENIVNEAKIRAVRGNPGEKFPRVTQDHLDDATQRVLFGLRKDMNNRVLTPEEIETLAVHEAGHAYVYYRLSGKAPLRFTIIGRGSSGGHVQFAEDWELLQTKQHLLIRLAVCMGGKAAVELFMDGQEDTGVSADLKDATRVAYQMVTTVGMTQTGLVSLAAFPDQGLVPEAFKRDTFEQVRLMLDNAMQEARTIIEEGREDMKRLIAAVKEKETLLTADFEAVFAEKKPGKQKLRFDRTPPAGPATREAKPAGRPGWLRGVIDGAVAAFAPKPRRQRGDRTPAAL